MHRYVYGRRPALTLRRPRAVLAFGLAGRPALCTIATRSRYAPEAHDLGADADVIESVGLGRYVACRFVLLFAA